MDRIRTSKPWTKYRYVASVYYVSIDFRELPLFGGYVVTIPLALLQKWAEHFAYGLACVSDSLGMTKSS